MAPPGLLERKRWLVPRGRVGEPMIDWSRPAARARAMVGVTAGPRGRTRLFAKLVAMFTRAYRRWPARGGRAKVRPHNNPKVTFAMQLCI